MVVESSRGTSGRLLTSLWRFAGYFDTTTMANSNVGHLLRRPHHLASIVAGGRRQVGWRHYLKPVALVADGGRRLEITTCLSGYSLLVGQRKRGQLERVGTIWIVSRVTLITKYIGSCAFDMGRGGLLVASGARICWSFHGWQRD